MNNWISVKDRLPEKDDRCLAVDIHGAVDCAWFDGERFNDLELYHCDMLFGDDPKLKNVTHWQPLPDKPQEEK